MSFAIGRDQQSLAGLVFNTLPIAPVQCRLAFPHPLITSRWSDDDSDAQTAPFCVTLRGLAGRIGCARQPAERYHRQPEVARSLSARCSAQFRCPPRLRFGGACRPRPAPAGAGFFFLSESHG
jgi:hypothetical protein